MSRCGFFLSAKADLILSHGPLSSDYVRFRGGVASGAEVPLRIGRKLTRPSALRAIPGGTAVSTGWLVAVRAILGGHPKELHRGDQHSRPADVRDAVRA